MLKNYAFQSSSELYFWAVHGFFDDLMLLMILFSCEKYRENRKSPVYMCSFVPNRSETRLIVRFSAVTKTGLFCLFCQHLFHDRLNLDFRFKFHSGKTKNIIVKRQKLSKYTNAFDQYSNRLHYKNICICILVLGCNCWFLFCY